MVTNVVSNSYIEHVTKKPNEVTYVYAGEGLSYSEVVKKYIEAIKDNDMVTVKSLQLENFYPEVFKSIIDKSDDYYDGGYVLSKPFSTHEFVKDGPSYFKNLQGDYTIGHSYEVKDNGKYGEYNFVRQIFIGRYCAYNNCDQELAEGEFIDQYYDSIIIELIEVDGNYYVGGERNYNLNMSEIIYHYVLLANKGDTTNLSFGAFDNMELDEVNEYLKSKGYKGNLTSSLDQ